jgi:hypothetical protein
VHHGLDQPPPQPLPVCEDAVKTYASSGSSFHTVEAAAPGDVAPTRGITIGAGTEDVDGLFKDGEVGGAHIGACAPADTTDRLTQVEEPLRSICRPRRSAASPSKVSAIRVAA